MAVRIVIHERGDRIYTLAANGAVKAYVVTANGLIESTDMTTAIEQEDQVTIHGAD